MYVFILQKRDDHDFLRKITCGQEEQRCGCKLDVFEYLYLVNMTYLVNLLIVIEHNEI